MINPNGRITKRKMVRLMIALTILAWATQTLMHQWGFGAEIRADDQPSNQSTEKFVPADRAAAMATLELRPEATVSTGEVKLRQIMRWADSDKAAVAPLADLVITRIPDAAPFKSVSLDEIKATLHDAGINLASINFVGTTTCTIARGDVQYDERVALQQWIAAKQGKSLDEADALNGTDPTTQPALTTTSMPATDANLATTAQVKPPIDRGANTNPFHSLRDLLIAEVSDRLNVPVESLQLTFKAQDEKLLNLSEPHFKFEVEPQQRVKILGPVRWNVMLIGGDGSSQKLQVAANVRLWQTQLLVTKPLAYKQVIRQSDVIERRALVDQMPDEMLVTADQAVGQQAARELKSGTVLTARMIDPVQLVKSGQFVTISVQSAAVQVRTVAKALEPGSFGQTIKVKNETTKEVFDVTVTGPQTATLNAPSVPQG